MLIWLWRWLLEIRTCIEKALMFRLGWILFRSFHHNCVDCVLSFQVIHHRPEILEGQLDFGTLAMGEKRVMNFTLRNDNPVDVRYYGCSVILFIVACLCIWLYYLTFCPQLCNAAGNVSLIKRVALSCCVMEYEIKSWPHASIATQMIKTMIQKRPLFLRKLDSHLLTVRKTQRL